jgi:hypothetical protein
MWRQAMMALVLQLAASGPIAAGSGEYVSPEVPHPGSDQIFWVPTLAQAEVAARETGRMILVMGSVGDWNGY